MCGIYFSIARGSHNVPSSDLTWLLRQRGPDSFRFIYRDIPYRSGSLVDNSKDSSAHLVFVATVLSLRGDKITVQPLVDESSGSLLCWNGEAWNIDGVPVLGNDAEAVFGLMLRAVHSVPEGMVSQREAYEATFLAFSHAIRGISGPFSFLFYDAKYERIFYGRDILGRRSLLVRTSSDPNLTISSIHDTTTAGSWSEVEADGIYALELVSFIRREVNPIQDYHREGHFFGLRHIPWTLPPDTFTLLKTCVGESTIFPGSLKTNDKSAGQFFRPQSCFTFW